MQEQRGKKSRNLFSIIVAIVIVVALVVAIFVWRDWEAKHKNELRSFMVAPESVAGPIESSADRPTPVKAAPELPEDPEALLAMAEDALKDEGYFESDRANKGFRVYFLLKKALECNCDVQKAEGLCDRLRECSAESNYGTWFVGKDLFAELDEKIETAKEVL